MDAVKLLFHPSDTDSTWYSDTVVPVQPHNSCVSDCAKKSNSKTTVLQSLLILCHGGYRARVTKADQMYLEHGNFLPHEDLTSQ